MNLQAIVEEGLKKNFIRRRENGDYYFNPEVGIPESLGFEDVAIKPAENICNSRLEASISSEFVRGLYLDVPLIAANMSTVVNAGFCIKLDRLGALGIMHRAWSVEADYLEEVKKVAEKCNIVAASIGIGDSQVELAIKLVGVGANIIVIDIANGYTERLFETAKLIKFIFPKMKLIVGNTTNLEMLYKVNDFADALKIGIGQGENCTTKNTAGATERQISAILKFKEEAKRLGMPIISDGGVREASHFVKSIGAGASSTMVGGVMARCPESAAPVVDGKKLHAGMSSRFVQERWRGMKPGTCAEGKTLLLDIGEPVAALIERYSGALRSGITYAGATDIKSFQEKVEFIRI